MLIAFAQVQLRAQQPGTDGGPVLPKPISVNLKQFEIPFSIDSAGVRPVEVQLYVSRDEGKQWDLYASQPATEKAFLFSTPQDGVYWFATRTVDATRKADTTTPIRPQQIIKIDTENPVVEIKAELRPDGKISVTLACKDQSPSIESLRIDYAIDQSRQWNAVNDVSGRSDPVDSDRFYVIAEFTPYDAWQQISVRALVGDLAGNKTIVTTAVDQPRVAATDFRLAATKSVSPAEPAPAPVAPTNPPMEAAAAEPTRVAQLPAAAAPPLYSPQPQNPAAPVYYPPSYPSVAAPTPLQLTGPSPATPSNAPINTPSNAASTAPSNWAVPQFSVSSGIAPANVTPAPAATGPLVGPELSAPLPPGEPPLNAPAAEPPPAQPRPKTAAAAMRPLGESDAAAIDPRQSASRVSPSQTTEADAAPMSAATIPTDGYVDNRVGEPIGDGLVTSGVQIRYSSSRKFSLDYEIESAGLAGVSDVELWGSRDRGLTWKRWGSDPDRESPFDIETNNDGAYGFRIVVVANNGLATPRPIENDLPDIFVVVDTLSPSIRFTGAAYGEGNQTGALVMRYECTDLNLTQRPITLSFGPSQTGPWSTIAAGLENEGAYVWPADPNLPRQIYLRIDALDLAGNLGSYVLDTPIDIQGLAPRARIRGFNPLTGSAGGTRPIANDSSNPTSGDRPQTATQPQARFK